MCDQGIHNKKLWDDHNHMDFDQLNNVEEESQKKGKNYNKGGRGHDNMLEEVVEYMDTEA